MAREARLAEEIQHVERPELVDFMAEIRAAVVAGDAQIGGGIDEGVAVQLAWRLKESFSAIWDCSHIGAAVKFLEAWCKQVNCSTLEPMKKVSQMLRNQP